MELEELRNLYVANLQKFAQASSVVRLQEAELDKSKQRASLILDELSGVERELAAAQEKQNQLQEEIDKKAPKPSRKK